MSSTDPLIGKKLGDYLIEGIQGTGGMARVYRGFDEKLERYAAVKVIEPQLIASAEEEEYRERFLREARSIARLSHARIVGIYQFGQYENLYYIAMEYIEGRNLREILKGYARQDTVMPAAEAVRILNDIADALDYAHRQSIIHRDVKPSNIIVNSEGHAILTDFGLALNALEGTIGNTFGSVHYIAPEQAISSAQAVAQSDQYSLGIIAYEMLTGRVPFDDASAMSVALKHISDPPPPPRDINPAIPVEVEQALIRALDKDLQRRYPTCRDFTKALENAFATAAESPSAVLPPKKDKTVASIAKPVPISPAEDDAPTVTDTSSRPKTVTSIMDTPGLTPAGRDRRMMYVVGGLVALTLLVVAILVLPSLLNPPVDENATSTAVARVAEQALNNTATAEARIQTAIAATSQSRLTSTALFQAQASVTAAVEASATAVAVASAEAAASQTAVVINATSTAEQKTIATGTAAALAAATATAEAKLSASQTAGAMMAASATKEARLNMTGTAVALAALTATEEPSDTPELTDTPSPSPTATPSPTGTSSFTPSPTHTATSAATPTPGLTMVDENDARILLRYDGRALVLYNRAAGILTFEELTSLQFHLFEPDEEGVLVETIVYEGDEWAVSPRGLSSRNCLLVFPSTLFRQFPEGDPPTDVCRSVSAFRGTRDVFWLSPAANQGAYFEVRRGPVDLIATCPVNIPETFSIKHCGVNLR